MFYRTRVVADRSFALQEYGFSTLFAFIDLDLMTFIYELDLYFLETYGICKY